MIGTAEMFGPVRAVAVEEEHLNFHEPVTVIRATRDFLFFRNFEVFGGRACLDNSGHVSPSIGFLFALLNICFSSKSTTYMLGSCTAKEFSKPVKERKIDRFVYSEHRQHIPYDLHTFHNATSYSAVSSQVSEETNFSILYRKISRYTEINVNRYGAKDIQTNAETLARLQYFAIREAYPNFAARQHF